MYLRRHENKKYSVHKSGFHYFWLATSSNKKLERDYFETNSLPKQFWKQKFDGIKMWKIYWKNIQLVLSVFSAWKYSRPKNDTKTFIEIKDKITKRFYNK
jgi:hypothetical protein